MPRDISEARCMNSECCLLILDASPAGERLLTTGSLVE
jgi:hypothetical protein